MPESPAAGEPGALRAPVAIALDAPDAATMQAWTRMVCPYVSTVKVGLEVYLREGPSAVAAARAAAADAGSPVELFLDLKLHDIPATVAGAARSIRGLAPDILTVHAAGGPRMVAAAAEALPDTRIAAVTVLTSLDAGDLAGLGIVAPGGDPGEVVVRWAVSAVDAGARAIVCSPAEVAAVRAAVPGDVVLITPGIRPAGADAGDQRRVATPRDALAAGADLLVVGRPVTGAADPAAAAADLAGECRAALG